MFHITRSPRKISKFETFKSSLDSSITKIFFTISIEMAMDIDLNVCFLCNEENLDMTAELKSLDEPISEVEAAFILEQCPVIDRDNWKKVFEGTTKSHPIPVDATNDQLPQNATDVVISESTLKLEVCHRCGLFSSH
jgi:hypothetical protein